MTAQTIKRYTDQPSEGLPVESLDDNDSRAAQLQRLAAWYAVADTILPPDYIGYIEQQYDPEADTYSADTPKRLSAALAAYEINAASPDARMLVQDAIGRLAIKMLNVRSDIIDSRPIDEGSLSSPDVPEDVALARYLELYADISHNDAIRTGEDVVKDRTRTLATTAINLLRFSDQPQDDLIEQLRNKLDTTYTDSYYQSHGWMTNPASQLSPSASPEKISYRAELQRARTESR